MVVAEKEQTTQTKFDLGERTITFAKRVRVFVEQIPHTLANIEDAKQLIRSSGSIAANYAEADEAISSKDFVLRLRICRKESKETRVHLQLISTGSQKKLEVECTTLMQEAKELVLIFASIIRKTTMK